VDRTPVSSSSLTSVGYDEPTQTLEVEFPSGSVYQYFDVPTSVYSELLGASSVGQYFAQNVRNSYRYARL
jgi:hypothetical protein